MTGICLSLGLSQSTLPVLPQAPQGPVPAFLGLAGGTVGVVTGPSLLTITVSGGTSQDGSYAVDPALLANGPVNLCPPTIGGTPAVGAALTSSPGLWVYDSARGLPNVGYQWQADGTAIPGATSAGYTVSSDAADKDVRLAVSATQAAGARIALSNALSIPGPIALLNEPDGTISITGSGLLTITISGSTGYDGIYVVDTVNLETGPINLVPAGITGNGAVGEALAVNMPGLWIYQGEVAPTLTGQWYSGTSATGDTDASYTVVSGDTGKDLTYVEKAMQGSLERSMASNAINIAAVGFTSPTDLKTKLFAWFDMTDPSTLFQNTAGTTPATAVGNPVQRVNDKSGNSRHIWKTDANNALVIAGGVNWNRAKLYAQGWTGVTSGMEVFALIEPDAGISWVLGGRYNDGGTNYLGYSGNGDASTYVQNGSFGTPTYSVNGTDIATPTRDKLYDAVKDTAGRKVMAARGVDLTGAGSSFAPVGYQLANTASLIGTIKHYVITTGLTTQERSDLVTWLMGQA